MGLLFSACARDAEGLLACVCTPGFPGYRLKLGDTTICMSAEGRGSADKLCGSVVGAGVCGAGAEPDDHTGGGGAFRATDFIGTSSYLSTDDNGSMVYLSPLQAESDTSLMDWGTDGRRLIPQTNRTVWSPVASPDGTQVAFLSKPADAGDPTIPPQLYVVPAQGGTPQEVAVGPDSDALGGGNPTLLAWL